MKKGFPDFFFSRNFSSRFPVIMVLRSSNKKSRLMFFHGFLSFVTRILFFVFVLLSFVYDGSFFFF